MYSSLGLAPPRISGGRGGWNDFFKYFYFSCTIYNLQSQQKKIKSQLGKIGRAGGPPPIHPRVLPLLFDVVRSLALDEMTPSPTSDELTGVLNQAKIVARICEKNVKK